MNPLSPLTYYRRHKRAALVLIALIALATMVLYAIIGVLDSLTLGLHLSYLSRLSLVRPEAGRSLEPGVISRIQAHPDVERVIPDNGVTIYPPTLAGNEALRLIGAPQDDLGYLMARCGVRLKEGRLLELRTNEFMLSEEIARALELEIGDRVGRLINENYYAAVLEPLVLVGILEGDPATSSGPSVRVGFVSYEYLESHELYAPRAAGVLVTAREGRKEAVDAFLETTIASARTEVETYKEAVQMATWVRRFLYLTFGIVNSLVAVVVAVVVGVINQIALTQRISELGLMHALGYRKRKLVRRLTLETAVVAGVGWIAGLALALLALVGLKSTLWYSSGMELDLANFMPFWFVLPIPLTVAGFAFYSVTRVFARLDAVAIVERGKLSLEADARGRRRPGKRMQTQRSSVKPLSSLTFYLRHRRRGIVLILSAALVIVGVALPAFLLSAVFDAMTPSFEHLRYISVVQPSSGRTVDPGVMGQIRSHPAAGRVVPVMSLGLQVNIPPSGVIGVSVYGASEDDLPALMDLLRMHVKEGRLPRPRSNEIVVSEPVALNRGLAVGDRIGVPVYERDEFPQLENEDIPAEMVVVGILSASSGQALSAGSPRRGAGQVLSSSDVWLGFASYEYLESHELTSSRPIRLLIVPADGRKNELDTWLEESVASAQTDVTTYGVEYREYRQIVRSLFLVFAVVGSATAIVAAIAMATLDHIFFTQRREEFGILHAVGRSRRWLVLRTVKETGSVVAVAWLIGAAVCVVSLIGAQAVVYAPRGLSLDLLNLVPWMFTLPIPLAVIVGGAGTVARMLFRLDPVAVIERR